MARRIAVCWASMILTGSIVGWAEGFQTYLGKTTVSSPTFTRPYQGGPSLDLTVHYHVQEFELPTGTTCYVYSAQDYDGYLHLYAGFFNPASPLTNLVAGNDDGDLSIGTSQLPNLSLAAGHYVLVTSGWGFTDVGSFQNAVHCDAVSQPLAVPCNGRVFSEIPAEDTLCLNNRFLVAIDSVSNSTTGGTGHPVHVSSKDTGIFWFYDSDVWEVMIKVINACGLPGFNNYWVFGGALTNQAYRIIVFDSRAPTQIPGNPRYYSNTFGTSAAAITDTAAFATCP